MKIYNIIIGLTISCMASAQQIVPLSYRQYMEKVAKGNLNYAAEQLNVNISEAELTAAKVFNDPNLSFSYFNNQNSSLQMGEGVSVELSKTFTFGKRGAGIALARSQNELTKALLNDYFRNLRAEATTSYLEALKQFELYKVKENAYATIQQLAKSDSIRFSLGKIMEINATQSRLEAGILHNDLLQASAELNNAFANLNLLTGMASHDTLFKPEATLRTKARSFVMADLLNTAYQQRADLVAALKNKEVAARALTVAKRDRNTDVDLSVGVSHNGKVLNEIAPAPSFTGITAGIAIPLKFSNVNKGMLNAARFRQQQADAQYQQALLQVQTEVLNAFRSYDAFCKQVDRYEKGMLSQAREVMDGKIYSYNRGEVSLLEVLDAQRTYDDVQAQYIETLFNQSAALVELEKSAGIWDVEL
jgi:cobalt-zinc-cadmium efflux system outer membrane protein